MKHIEGRDEAVCDDVREWLMEALSSEHARPEIQARLLAEIHVATADHARHTAAVFHLTTRMRRHDQLAAGVAVNGSPVVGYEQVSRRPNTRTDVQTDAERDKRSDPLWLAALAAPSTPPSDVGGFWQAFLEGRFRSGSQWIGPDRSYVLAQVATESGTPRCALNRIETAVLVRVLCGEQQKLIAMELGIGCSTASKWYAHAVAKLGLNGRPIASPIVIAAQAWAMGREPALDARVATVEHGGSTFLLISVPRPRIPQGTPLTPAEREVAALLVDGGSRQEIALCRGSSVQTVASHVRGLFSKLEIVGRYALIRRALDLGWFC
jgi:DNA-binding NarL/FixJ family response regulator